MNIRLFNKKYWVRRFGEQENVQGHLVSPFSDFVISAHLHPAGSDEMQANPEGQRKVKHIEGHSETQLVVADQSLNRRGDLVYYYGAWYECIRAQYFDHTLLSHFNYVFAQVPLEAAKSRELMAPSGNPTSQAVM